MSSTETVPTPINSSTAAALRPHSDDTRERAQEPDRPTLEDVLAEIDPFLESVRLWAWRDFVRHTVFRSFENRGAHPPSCPKSPEGRRWRATDEDPWYSYLPPLNDVRRYNPPLRLDAYADHSIPALVELVSILQLAGVDIDLELRGATPAECVVGAIGNVEVEIRKSIDAANQPALDQQLSYLCQLVKVLINAGAREIIDMHRTLLHAAIWSQSVCMVERFLNLLSVFNGPEGTTLHFVVRICHFGLIFSGFLDIVTVWSLKQTGGLTKTMQHVSDQDH